MSRPVVRPSRRLSLTALAAALVAWAFLTGSVAVAQPATGAEGPEGAERLRLDARVASHYRAGRVVQVLEEAPLLTDRFERDSSGASSPRLTIDDVRSPTVARRFRPLNDGVLAKGYQASAYWLRVMVQRPPDASETWFLEVANKGLDAVTLYRPDSTGAVHVTRTGDAGPFDNRPRRHRNFVFPLSDVVGTQTLYLRVVSGGPMIVPVHFWARSAFDQKERVGQFLLGLFFGVLLVMALYNLFLFAALRDAAYGYYVLYILAYIVYQVANERIGAEYFWPNNVWWGERASSTLALLCGIAGIQFSRAFLYTRRLTPRLDTILKVLMVASAVFFGLNLAFGGSALMNQATAVLFVLIAGMLSAAAFRCWRQGSMSAQYYLLAWSMLLAGTITTMLTFMGVLPYSFWTLRSVQIGAVLEVVLLSLGLGARFTALRDERARMRLRIASDLHDDIGSGLTQISMYSELAQRTTGADADAWTERIGELARTLTGRMQDIVWSIKPGDASWESVELRMKDHAVGMLTAADIAFNMDGEAPDVDVTLSPDERQNVLLVFKEAVHNAVKHANASTVDVSWHLTPTTLRIRIVDDGDGFDADAHAQPGRGGHGLMSMQQRAETLGGTVRVVSRTGVGTCVDIAIPLTNGTMERFVERRGGRTPELPSSPFEASPDAPPSL